MKQRKKSVKRGEVQYSLSLDVSSWGMKNGLESNYEHLGIAVIQKALEDYVELLRQRANGKLPRKSRGKFTAETYELLEAEAFLKENRCQAFFAVDGVYLMSLAAKREREREARAKARREVMSAR
ncbi:hypothetical protein [Stomatobaculum longum]|uniref:hypothetical protein n=1 Tax=Stomatobaculum longum TaxID=796942 RepID=UPI0028DC8C3F|nr:hypothetical protein [Stomatobaculum longum]